jgi:calcineurin-like phosphoesterase family protein
LTRTLIVSDLHLGSATHVDVLRRAELRAPLLAALEDVDRLVLLGDVLELRHGPRREALAAARPFFEDLGRVFAAREVVVAAGNHDHALVEQWLARRNELPVTVPAELGVEQRFTAREASPMVAQLAEWAAPARLSVAYPGLWVRPDVYAIHGHYLDCHLTIPTMERLGIGAMGRVLRRPADTFAGVDDYEAVTAPVFAWIDAVARQAPTGGALNGSMTVRAWRAFGGGRGHGGGRDHAARPSDAPHSQDAARTSRNGRRAQGATLARALRTRALAGAFPLGVAALNRAGLGPFNADISSGELRRAGLRAMGEVAQRLDLIPADPAYVVFGHTHRAGPLPGDRQQEWLTPGGGRLVNAGCWTYDPHFLTSTPGESPYWPGCCVLVEEDGPPRVRRLLDDREQAELAPAAH